MLKITSTYPRATQVLEEYRRWVVGQSKANLSKGKKNASGALKNSIKGKISKKFKRDSGGRFMGGSDLPSLRFSMKYYGAFIDEGVKGSESTYGESLNSPYKFRNNRGSVPVDAIRRWVAQRGLPKTAAYPIARSIYKKGIKAKKFFTKPFNKRFNSMVNQYHTAVADDIAANIYNKLKRDIKK